MSYLLPRPLLSLLLVRQGSPQQLLVRVLHRGQRTVPRLPLGPRVTVGQSRFGCCVTVGLGGVECRDRDLNPSTHSEVSCEQATIDDSCNHHTSS
jgi:hypothetical protein